MGVGPAHDVAMTSDDRLTPLPESRADRSLWMQHGIGYLLMRDVREPAIATIPQEASEDARAAAVRAINNTLYRLMMLVDGVSRPLANDDVELTVDLVGTIERLQDDAEIDVQGLKKRRRLLHGSAHVARRVLRGRSTGDSTSAVDASVGLDGGLTGCAERVGRTRRAAAPRPGVFCPLVRRDPPTVSRPGSLDAGGCS